MSPDRPPIDVYLITGFLGSGKTTLLNRLINAFPAGVRLMVLMNEFGEIGIDGQLIQGPAGMEILEISRGSVFCVCVKTDFIKALAAIAREIRPQVLIIEATGTANPTDIKKDLTLSIFEDRFRFKEQICLLDAENFMATYQTFAAIEKQMAAATRFVLNKIDLASTRELAAIRAVVRTHHPRPIIHETTYARMPLKDWLQKPAADAQSGKMAHGPTHQAVDQAIAALLNDPLGTMAPPDPLGAAVYGWSGGDETDWEALAAQFPGEILRAKGFLEIANRTHLFSRVGTTQELTPWEKQPVPREMVNRLVVIGSPAALEELQILTATQPRLKLLTRRDPFAAACD